MEVSPSANVSQSLALAAHFTQQQQAATRPRDSDRGDNESVDAKSTVDTQRHSANITFSPEALQLSAQSNQDDNRNTVNKSNESEATKQQLQQQQQAAHPESVRSQGAASVAQAINAYHNTSLV